MRSQILGVVMFAISITAAATDLEWNGFLSVGGGQLTNDESIYLDFDDDLSFSSDSIFALQVKSQITPKWSLTAQVVGRGDSDFDTEIEWAFITYEGNAQSTIRLGLLRAPLYNYSEFLEVGYAYNWIRPPRDVYDRIPFTNFNGIDYSYNMQWGSWDTNFQMYFGRKDEPLDGGNIIGQIEDFSSKNWGGLILNFSQNWLSLRFSHHVTKISADITQTKLAPLITALKSPGLDFLPVPGLGDRFRSVGKELLVEGVSVNFNQVSVDIDYNNYLLISEYTRLNVSSSPIPSDSRWYLMMGYRYADWTLHVTYGQAKIEEKKYTEGLDGLGDPDLEALVDALRDLGESTIEDTKTITVGLRYEVDSRSVFKLEWQQLNDLDYNIENNHFFEKNNHLIAFSIDMIF